MCWFEAKIKKKIIELNCNKINSKLKFFFFTGDQLVLINPRNPINPINL